MSILLIPISYAHYPQINPQNYPLFTLNSG